MLKLYRLSEEKKEYWETWSNDDGSHRVHWGVLGTTGESKVLQKSLFHNPQKAIQKEIDNLIAIGFSEVDQTFTLMVEYSVDGFGTPEDLDKRARLLLILCLQQLTIFGGRQHTCHKNLLALSPRMNDHSTSTVLDYLGVE